MKKKFFTNQILDICRHHDVVLAYLFGSHTRGTAGPLSDVDLGIIFSNKVPASEFTSKEFSLRSELAELLQREDIDIINLRTSRNPLLKHRIVFFGHPFLINDANEKFQIERKIMREYEDTEPLRRVQYAHLQHRLQTNTFGKFRLKHLYGTN